MAKQKPDPRYLQFIRLLPCLICRMRRLRQRSPTEAHHYGPRGLGTKVPDKQAIPLCGIEHHRLGREAVHVLGRRFADHHKIDVWGEIERLNTAYAESL